mmetsp:Transcript_4419/g.11034  ORF Transcript_4419/g.11034 Transcript_4419/m.11034 type:complete len:337 (+) Transcript_4419:369-1379(+)
MASYGIEIPMPLAKSRFTACAAMRARSCAFSSNNREISLLLSRAAEAAMSRKASNSLVTVSRSDSAAVNWSSSALLSAFCSSSSAHCRSMIRLRNALVSAAAWCCAPRSAASISARTPRCASATASARLESAAASAASSRPTSAAFCCSLRLERLLRDASSRFSRSISNSAWCSYATRAASSPAAEFVATSACVRASSNDFRCEVWIASASSIARCNRAISALAAAASSCSANTSTAGTAAASTRRSCSSFAFASRLDSWMVLAASSRRTSASSFRTPASSTASLAVRSPSVSVSSSSPSSALAPASPSSAGSIHISSCPAIANSAPACAKQRSPR